MSLRIGFDMDGVLADFSGAFREHEIRLFGSRQCGRGQVRRPAIAGRAPAIPKKEEERQAKAEVEAQRESRRREDAVWEAIESTPNFWTTLKPLDERAVRGFTS